MQVLSLAEQTIPVIRHPHRDVDVLVGSLGNVIGAACRSQERSAVSTGETIALIGYDRHAMPERFGNGVAATIGPRVQRYVDFTVGLQGAGAVRALTENDP